MDNIDSFLASLKQFRTYDGSTGGYGWKIPKAVLSNPVAQSYIRGALDSIFGYAGTFSNSDDGVHIVFSFGNAGNWDRFAEFCSSVGIKA